MLLLYHFIRYPSKLHKWVYLSKPEQGLHSRINEYLATTPPCRCWTIALWGRLYLFMHLYKQIVPSKPSIKYTPPSLPSLLHLISIQFSITHYNNSQWLHLRMVWHTSLLMVLLTHFYAIKIIFSCHIYDMYIISKSRPCIDDNPFNQ